MAKITIVGDSLVVSSAMTLKEIQTLAKYNPSALKLHETDENGKKNLVFEVFAIDGPGSISSIGAAFGSSTRDDKKLAAITLPLDRGIENAKDYVADKYGVAIMRLNKIEEGYKAALDAVETNKKAILENITVA